MTHQKHTQTFKSLSTGRQDCVGLPIPTKSLKSYGRRLPRSKRRASVSFFRRSRYSEPLCQPRRKSVTVKLPLALAQILDGERHYDYEYDRFIFISKDLDIIHRSHLWIFSPPPLASRTLPHHHRTHPHSGFIFQRSWGNVIRSGSTPNIDVT